MSYEYKSIEAKSTIGLMKVIRALENAVFPMDADQMWNGCFPVVSRQENAKIRQDMVGHFTGLKSTLEELGHLSDTLECLKYSLERKISSMKAIYKSSIDLVLSHGINTVPVEVLNRIFEMAYCEDTLVAFKLSLVDKKFHAVVMRNPCLWNRINNIHRDRKARPEQLRVSLKRSEDVGLNVEIDFDLTSTFVNGIRTLGVAVEEASRWENVTFVMETQYEGRLDLFRVISENSNDLNLPRLKSANLCYPGLHNLIRHATEGIFDHSEPLMHFYTTWHMPNLTNLTVRNLFPRPFLRFTPPLTALNVEVSENEYNEFKRLYDMNLLLEFLRSSPLLETFCLRLDLITPSTKYDDHTLPETVLPNLRTFQFSAKYWRPRHFLPFMKALRFPSLRNLHVCADADYPDDEGLNWLECTLPLSHEEYMNVEVFSFKAQTWGRKSFAGWHYDAPYEKLHNLRSMTLETPFLKPNISRNIFGTQTRRSYGAENYLKLEDIHFVKCNALDEVELRSFKKLLEEQGNWDALKRITFEKCESLSEGTVRSLFEGKDVTWKFF